ncbi:hypothetical protein JTE90_020053 [Oedothorax gibbosus]|uniref:Uncharacterized protein n=1 Tax=Oedothorax gibbosus TaxID=931172 RepID=A0AAV6UUI3_9ARAC|nr:hypothetical protein JTE90_020053 [Oedothorax gibbosus]
MFILVVTPFSTKGPKLCCDTAVADTATYGILGRLWIGVEFSDLITVSTSLENTTSLVMAGDETDFSPGTILTRVGAELLMRRVDGAWLAGVPGRVLGA